MLPWGPRLGRRRICGESVDSVRLAVMPGRRGWPVTLYLMHCHVHYIPMKMRQRGHAHWSRAKLLAVEAPHRPPTAYRQPDGSGADAAASGLGDRHLDSRSHKPSGVEPLQWRAGEFPRLTATHSEIADAIELLQWRAGEFPRLTTGREAPAVRRLSPSMEGGGIPPPDVLMARAPAAVEWALQWRAGEFPRLTSTRSARRTPNRPLQWRAGEFPRLTRPKASTIDAWTELAPSMEGGGIPPPDRAIRGDQSQARFPSMEGGGNSPRLTVKQVRDQTS